MKKLLFLLPLLAIISCSPERVYIDDTQPERVDIDDRQPERVHIDDTQKDEEAKMLFYQGKPFTGIVYDVYSEGQLKFERTYKEGLCVFTQNWFENGQISSQVTYKDKKLNGLWQAWWMNGRLAYQLTSKDGKKDGLYQEWDKNGQLRFKGTYKDGWLE